MGIRSAFVHGMNAPRLARTMAICAGSILCSLAHAQSDVRFDQRCRDWVAKHGYSRDYIEQKIGQRPPPRARWRDNIKAEELQVGDVVGLNTWPGHVALIEEIGRDADNKPLRLTVSSFNYGRGMPWIDKDCEVSGRFGVAMRQVVTMADTNGYWRPAGKR